MADTDVARNSEPGGGGPPLGRPPDGVAPLIVDYRIADLVSFDATTRDDRAVAGLLFYKELDCLVDLAHLIWATYLKGGVPDGAR